MKNKKDVVDDEKEEGVVHESNEWGRFIPNIMGQKLLLYINLLSFQHQGIVLVDESQQDEEMNEMKLAEGVRLLYTKPQKPGRKVRIFIHNNI